MLNPRDVKTIEDARRIVEERNLTHVKVGVFDIDGVMRGKYINRSKFFTALEHGSGFCDVVLGWDVKDQLYDNVQYTGWHTAYPDAPVRIVPHSCREIPFENGMLLFIAEFDRQAEAICPRGTLQRVIQRCRAMGFDPFAALEYEFFLFDETPDSVRAKGFRNLKNLSPDWFGYSTLRNSVHAELYHAILDLAERMDFPIESLHSETGPGVIEAAIAAELDALFAERMEVARPNRLFVLPRAWISEAISRATFENCHVLESVDLKKLRRLRTRYCAC